MAARRNQLASDRQQFATEALTIHEEASCRLWTSVLRHQSGLATVESPKRGFKSAPSSGGALKCTLRVSRWINILSRISSLLFRIRCSRLLSMSTPLFVPRNDTNLIGNLWSGNGPTVVLLHAGVCDRRSWEVVAPEVSKHATVVSYDRRGFGDTAPGTSSFTHLDDLCTLLDQLQIAKAWLVGSSAGGKLALDAAISLTKRVAGLVLLSPAVTGAPPPDRGSIDPELLRINEQIEQANERGDLGEVNRLEIQLWLDGPREQEGRVTGVPRELALDMNRIALANAVSENSDQMVSAWSRLSEVGVSATVACGAFDATHMLVRSEELSTRIPRAKYLVLDRMAHLPYLEEPLAVAELIIGAIADR